MKPEIVNFEKPPSEFDKALSILKSNIGPMMEYQSVVAKLKKHAFQCYIKEGFTEQQALELSKTIT